MQKERCAMKVRSLQLLSLALLCSLLLVRSGGHSRTVHAFGYDQLNPIQRRILSGFAEFTLNPAHASEPVTAVAGATRVAAAVPTTSLPAGNGCPPRSLGSDIRVNQNCQNITDPDLRGRGQAQNE